MIFRSPTYKKNLLFISIVCDEPRHNDGPPLSKSKGLGNKYTLETRTI